MGTKVHRVAASWGVPRHAVRRKAGDTCVDDIICDHHVHHAHGEQSVTARNCGMPCDAGALLRMPVRDPPSSSCITRTFVLFLVRRCALSNHFVASIPHLCASCLVRTVALPAVALSSCARMLYSLARTNACTCACETWPQ